MPPRSISDAKHWRDRAARIRAVAVTMADTQAGILLTDLAADYDKLAEAAAIKANGPTGKVRTKWQAQDKAAAPRALT
jgi:hypothetical protein